MASSDPGLSSSERGEDSRMSWISYASLPCAGVLTALLQGCSGGFDPPASIDYRQIGFCNTYATPKGTQTARPNEVYIIYKIDTVDNTKRNTDFMFLPTRLWVERATVKQAADESKQGVTCDQASNRQISVGATTWRGAGLVCPACQPPVCSERDELRPGHGCSSGDPRHNSCGD